MFGTTENFLKRFNIESVECLPNYDDLMERIKLIREEEDQTAQGDTLFKNTDDIVFEEDAPDFLKDEDFIAKIEGDE